MPPSKPRPANSSLPTPQDYKALAAQFAAAKRRQQAENAIGLNGDPTQTSKAPNAMDQRRHALELQRKAAYERRWGWTVGFWVWMLVIHAVGIAYFTSGFLLTRLVLDEKSSCSINPVQNTTSGDVSILPDWKGKGTVDGGCWHPKTFERAVVVIIDALRYDFTVPVEDDAEFHNAFPFLYETAVQSPNNAFLRPFIADPPTATMQRLKGLTTGTLPTFVDIGSSFSGTAIEEDNLLLQFRDAGKKIVHLGDDTWDALFPAYFEANMSQSYDSFNVWDLHSVDNGVLEHIFPLVGPERKGQWDVLIGHLLGVDHAGHRYGPAHTAMTAKLRQMDDFIRDLAAEIDDDTVLVVMGDHGMDPKGDHGGESDDEIEAALWVYAKKPVFGRTKPEFVTPPASAKERPVNQIDLVPTLALLLGIPIPYNSLGAPIEEAFAGKKGDAWNSLASAARVAAAGIQRYQASYFAARGIEPSVETGSPSAFFQSAENTVKDHSWTKSYEVVYSAFMDYQAENLKVCKSLWARFDVPSMIIGLVITGLGLVALVLYVTKEEDEDLAELEDFELDIAEQMLAAEGARADSDAHSQQDSSKTASKAGLVGAGLGGALGAAYAYLAKADDYRLIFATAAIASTVAVVVALLRLRFVLPIPTSIWGWLAATFTISQSIGFASNSYTIWEDSILLFFITTFGVANALAAINIENKGNRYLAIYHSLLFAVLGRVASFSKLCRDEQYPYCKTTYYASSTSSTSATWHLAIPIAVFAVLPSIIKAYYEPTRSYNGLAPTWIGYVLRCTLFLSAAYWTMDAADNGNWISSLREGTLKTASVYTAQLALGIAVVAGITAFVWAPACIAIVTTPPTAAKRAQVAVLGFGNANGARYLLLPLNIMAACIVLSKPMGGGAMALMMWQVLSLVEVLDLNEITSEPIGPVMLGILGNFHYFKTGHQAVLSSIQWDAAFIPLFTMRYPWSPIAVALNHFAGHILAAACVPLIVLWKTGPKRKGVLNSASRALGILVAYYAVESLATMAWTGYLRRHLMLYRVFNPRFMMAAAVLLIVDLVGILIALTGVRLNTLAIGEVFGMAE
ncbi:GPI ethanolamine phosphate transferase 3-like protein [Coniella lustricola]|uniref:GPI ethanolamine phosphate transferase 3-like protein n=1 Tax=Coniella lustricola TaxID=2025994 RepID=A0A2T3A663_9PEZI|nr:GPI ethanolamine phosphate transferase 3-like protein [Coniella lustricola]